jgi:hypothetical protein
MLARTNELTDLLDGAHKLLDEGRPADALDLINRSGQRSASIQNARGVCMLRTGKYDQAMAIFRDLVFPGGSLSIDPKARTVFQTNYAASLLMAGNVVVGESILSQIQEKKHPAVVRLKLVVKRWKKSLGLLRAALLLLGAYPDKPVSFDFAPGDL